MAAATGALVAVYESLGPIIADVGPKPRDRWLIAAETAITRGRWPPLSPLDLPAFAVDLFSVAYVVYFAMPGILAAQLMRRGEMRAARLVARTLFLAFAFHYVLYFVVPAVGPIRAPEVPAAVRLQLASQGGGVTHAVRRAIAALERTPQDAFPSAHTSIAILVAVFARRLRVKGHYLYASGAAAIVCSTVVLGYHYLLDVVGALPIVWAALRVAAKSAYASGALDRGFASHLKSPPWRSSITSTSA